MSELAELDIALCREDFPILQQQVHGKPLVYLDSGATSQKSQSVIDAVANYYRQDNANVHRAVYTLSERATAAYESARQNVKNFINANRNHEIIFTRGTTEAINLVASSFGRKFIKENDEIILTHMEHHSNIVPWQILCEQVGAQIKVVKVKDDGTLDLDHYKSLLNARTKMVSIIHVSNVLGTINPVKEMTEWAHQYDAVVLLDGAQAVPHMAVDVQDLECDFYAFSSHKMYGPTGVGVLYGKEEWLDAMPPYQSGGDMISHVSFENTEYNVLPHKFEAGTPNMAGVIGLGEAVRYIEDIGMDKIEMHERVLTAYATNKLAQVAGLTIIGNNDSKIGVISFVLDGVHPHDIGTILDQEGIAVRTGHHCAMPLIERFNVPATVRVSLGIYNHRNDIDRLVAGLTKVAEMFA